MKKRRTIVSSRIIPAVIALLILYACAEKEAVRPVPQQPVPDEKVTPELLFKKIDFSDISTLRAEIRLDIRKKGESKGVFPGVLAYGNPDRLNVRIFGPLGLTVIETLLSGGNVQVLIPPKDTLYAGSLPFDRLLPESKTLLKSVWFIEETDDSYVLYITGAAKETGDGHVLPQNGDGVTLKAKYFFDRATISWNAVELYAQGKKQVRIEIYKTDGSVPSDIGIRVRDAFFHLELKDIVINGELKEEFFKPLEASQTLPLSRFLRSREPSQ